MTVKIQKEDFDLSTELVKLRAGNLKIGAVVSFVGLVRDLNDGESVSEINLEHYPGMTEKSLDAIVVDAKKRWNIFDALIIHRVGTLKPGEQIVLVVVTGAHRGEAFAACEFVIDYLKTSAPFWKKEQTTSGSRWVEARASDETSAKRWKAK